MSLRSCRTLLRSESASDAAPETAPARFRPALLGIALLLGLLPGLAGAATIEATATAFTGDPISVGVTIDDGVEAGHLVITLEVEDGAAGDLRGFFANVADESLLAGLSVSGDHVTGSVFAADAVINLGQGSNLNGGGTPCPCDLGVEIGAPGIGGGDDHPAVVFTLSHADVDLDVGLFADQLFGVRVTSVGDLDGARGGSSKLAGVVPEPSTSLLMLLGLAGLSSVRPASRR